MEAAPNLIGYFQPAEEKAVGPNGQLKGSSSPENWPVLGVTGTHRTHWPVLGAGVTPVRERSALAAAQVEESFVSYPNTSSCCKPELKCFRERASLVAGETFDFSCWDDSVLQQSMLQLQKGKEKKKRMRGEDRATKVCTRTEQREAQTSGCKDASSTAWSSPKRSPPSTATSFSTDCYFLFPIQLHTEFCNKSALQGWQLCALQLRLSHQRHLKPSPSWNCSPSWCAKDTFRLQTMQHLELCEAAAPHLAQFHLQLGEGLL